MHYATAHILAKITATLKAIYNDTTAAEHAAWWLLQKLTDKRHIALILAKEITLSKEQETQLDTWLYDMVHNHKPLAYILGTVPFLDVTIIVEPPILIPRPETEEWCATLIKKITTQNPRTILDMCTGSGCIALALAHSFPSAQVTAVDIMPHAIALAMRNATENNIPNVTYILSDVYTKLPNTSYDLIVSNPPYISKTEWDSVECSVKNWEDKTALLADDNGLALIKKIIAQAPQFLKPGGELWIEIGYHQGPAVKEFFRKNGFGNVQILTDYNGNDRVVCGGI